MLGPAPPARSAGVGVGSNLLGAISEHAVIEEDDDDDDDDDDADDGGEGEENESVT